MKAVIGVLLRRFAVLTVLVFSAGTVAGTANAQLIPVPPGNRHAEQPAVAPGAVARTRATKGSFQAKYEKIRDLIARDRQLQQKIKRAAARYGIAPVHIVGALVGEHTYNVDALDRIQTYVVKAASYLGSDLTFAHDGEKVSQFVQRPEFAHCAVFTDSYDLWSCREQVWEEQFRGRSAGGKNWPDDRFGRVFFQPLYAGQTFGLGQLNPLTALRVNDMVRRVSGLPRLSPDQAPEIYKTIMDPDSTMDYMAAVLRNSIDAYAQLAGMDISGNPGITATLYNLGDVRKRALSLRVRNEGAEQPVLPEENYYGWLVNEKLDELLPLVR
ncbi:MAG: DUF1402 family protein [Pseudomonadota bacterium]|nr:DUF1402 family protein [Pseudomonadota bacterium]